MSDDNRQPDRGPLPDELVNALFDRELSPDAQRQILRAVRHDPSARAKVERTAELLAALRSPPEAPDLTGPILARADRRRRFLPARLRRAATLGRSALVGLALIAVLGIAGAQRLWPEATTLAPQQTPLTDVDEAVRFDASMGARTFRQTSVVIEAAFAPEALPAEPAIARVPQCEPRELLTAGLAPRLPGAAPETPPSPRCGPTGLGSGGAFAITARVEIERSRRDRSLSDVLP